MRKKMPYDDDRAKRAALQMRAGQPGVIVPGNGVRDVNVTHVCPECGGRFNTNTIQVSACKVCWGTGELTNAQLDEYQARLLKQAHDEERHNGTR